MGCRGSIRCGTLVTFIQLSTCRTFPVGIVVPVGIAATCPRDELRYHLQQELNITLTGSGIASILHLEEHAIGKALMERWFGNTRTMEVNSDKHVTAINRRTLEGCYLIHISRYT